MTDCKISIIVPVYNAEKTLDRCMESLVKQSHRNLEIILINDGSTDTSPEICRRWADSDPRIVYISKENGGVSSARNAGLDRASGAYVGFVDADDYADEGMFAYLLALASEHHAQAARVSYYIIERDGSLVVGEPDDAVRVLEGDDIIASLSRQGHKSVVLWNKLLLRSAIGDIRFESDLIVGEDLYFLFEVFQTISTYVTHDVPYYYYYLSETQCSWRPDFNYQGLKTMKRIVERSDCPIDFYARFFAYSAMLINDIVLHGYDYSFDEVRKDVLSKKEKIRQSLKKNNDRNNILKFRLLCISGFLYRLLLKIRG